VTPDHRQVTREVFGGSSELNVVRSGLRSGSGEPGDCAFFGKNAKNNEGVFKSERAALPEVGLWFDAHERFSVQKNANKTKETRHQLQSIIHVANYPNK
jgi:hypothetical protein